MIIDIEGTDGSGKKTQADLLFNFLKGRGCKVLKISFPNYESPSSALVKMFLGGKFGNKADIIDSYQASAFYSVDRVATMANININEYDFVLFDRYVPSNMIHQAVRLKDLKEKEKFLNWLDEFEYDKMRLPRPDKILFLDMPVAVSLKLANNRKELKNCQDHDIFEENKEHMYNAYENAKYIADKYNWITINCSNGEIIKSIDEIHEELLTKLNLK